MFLPEYTDSLEVKSYALWVQIEIIWCLHIRMAHSMRYSPTQLSFQAYVIDAITGV